MQAIGCSTSRFGVGCTAMPNPAQKTRCGMRAWCFGAQTTPKSSACTWLMCIAGSTRLVPANGTIHLGHSTNACQRPSLPSDVWNALRTGKVRSGIEPLSVGALYVVEKMLSDEIRARGVRLQGGDHSATGPRAFAGRLDHAFPSQMVSRFVRIDLSLPDDVLRADLDHFLATDRRSLAEVGGEQPYREAARLKLKAHELRTLAKVGLLQFLDLDRWQRAEGLNLSLYAVREMAGVVDRSREAELRRRVTLTLNQLQLHAWFARLDRGGGRARRS